MLFFAKYSLYNYCVKYLCDSKKHVIFAKKSKTYSCFYDQINNL